MKKSLSILFAVALVLAASCSKEPQYPAQPDWSKFPDPSEEPDDGLLKPAPCEFNVVAHRGGSSEAGLPDNSIASLNYAKELGCYASECDIYWTKDNNVIVAHADGQCKINGLHPWEATVAEIRAAGTLSNGEQIPTLAEFIDVVCVEGSCTRLWPDIKNITSPSTLTQYPINATKRACEIIVEKGAQHFVEFICTGNTTVMKSAYAYANNNGIAIGWMSNQSAIAYEQNGYPWANLAAKGAMGPEAGGEGARTLDEFVKKGIALSVYNVDKKAGDGNAVYSEKAIKYYTDNYKSFKALCTNYPKWLIETIEDATKTYDGIRSEDELFAFVAETAKDPEAKRFQNDDGEVVLHKDITVTKAWTPIESFSGIFDGGKHTITLNVEMNEQYLAIFKTLTGTVKNLNIAGSIKSTFDGNAEYATASIAAILDGGFIDGCTNNASVTDSGISTGVYANVGGVVAIVKGNSAAVKNCTNNGKITIANKCQTIAGGVVAYGQTNSSAPTLLFENLVNTADFEANHEGANWNYLGGVIGKMGASSNPFAKFYIRNCSNSGNYNIVKAPKTRGGGIFASCGVSTDYEISGCTFSGKVNITSTEAVDRCIAAVGPGFSEGAATGTISNCTFSGKMTVADGGNLYLGGIYGNNGSANIVIDGCKTTSKSSITGFTSAKSVGMIAARPNKAGFTIKNCKIAGTVTSNSGAQTVISAANIADWMFKGDATSVAVTLTDNGFNNE